MHWREFRSHVSYLSAKDQERVERAFVMGMEAHKDQKRKSGEPYFTHPIAVARILTTLHADADTIIASLLHDSLEDTDLTLREIDDAFNGDVGSMIDGLTKLNKEDVETRPGLDEQIETLRKMFTLMQEDVRVMVVKLADRLHNMQTIEHLPANRQVVLAEETQKIYVKIADRLCMQDFRDELEELSLQILDPPLLASLRDLQKQNDPLEQETLKIMKHELHALTGKDLPVKLVTERTSWEKLQTQLATGGKAVTGTTPFAIAFVTRDIDDCYRVLGLLHQCWQREILSFQDYINSPTINGYRGIHTTVILENGRRVRCKIRTEEMQRYAMNGIATLCFDSSRGGLSEYLPWLQRIAPLSESTQDRSNEFWESLQSDVLGDSIIVHGPGGETVMVPSGASVLDALFYIFKDRALSVLEVRINGKAVPLHAPLPNAASVDMEIARRPTVHREWLEWVHTGLAVAQIRQALASQSEQKKHTIGADLLREHLIAQKKGFIEEFSPEAVRKGLLQLGFNSLQSTYSAIADGRLQPSDVSSALFQQSKHAKKSGGRELVLTRIVFFPGNLEVVMNLTRIFQHYREWVRGIRLGYNPLTGNCSMRMRVLLHQEQIRPFIAELQSSGAVSVERTENQMQHVLFGLKVGLLMVIWGFDPVMAYLLIHSQNIGSIDLTIIRFWSLTSISALLLVWQQYKRGLPETRLPLRNSSLWLSVALLLVISLSTYQSLQDTQPAAYTIPMTSAGILLTSIVHRKRRLLLAASWLLILGGIALLWGSDAWTWKGMIFTLIAVTAFSAFSIISERYKREEHIGARAAQYFFVLSVLCALLTLPLLPLSTIHTLTPSVLGSAIVFSICFAGLPYYLYYYLLTHRQIDFVLRYSFIIIFTTSAGQLLILPGIPLTGRILLSSLLVIMGATLPLIMNEIAKARARKQGRVSLAAA